MRCVAPTLIQEPGDDARPIEAKRAELAAVPAESCCSAPRRSPSSRAIGDNTGSMALKGASPDHEGPAEPDRWSLDDQLEGSPRAGPSTPRATSSRPREARAARGRARAAGLRAGGQADCANRHAGDLRIIPALVGFPVEIKTAYGHPGCDLPGDAITSVIARGDGSSSATTAGVPGRCVLARLRCRTAYGTAGSYRVVVSSFNARTGITTTDLGLQVAVPRRSSTPARGPCASACAGGPVCGSPAASCRPPSPTPSRQLQRYSARIEWGDGTVGNGTVTVRGAVLSVTGRHTWRRPLRRGRIVVTVTDAATHGTLTIRRAVRIA